MDFMISAPRKTCITAVAKGGSGYLWMELINDSAEMETLVR